jgi:peptide/nickel transport system substrate-binding protein
VRAIGHCLAIDDESLVIELSEPRATLLTDLEVPILRADEARLPPRSAGELDGLGPFRVSAIDSESIRLEPADTGLAARPARAVVVRTVRDENARALRLLAGRSDIAPNAISPTLLPALEGRANLKVVSRRGANVTYILMHNERAPFDKLIVRTAVAQAIDRDLIVKTLFAGRARVASSLLPPGHWASPRTDPIPYQPDEARKAFANLPSVTLLTGTDRSRVTIARAIAQMLGDAGLRVRVVPLDFGVLLTRLDAGDYEMALLQMPELTEPNVLKWFFHPNAVPGEGGEGRNRARYRDARAGELLDEASEIVVRDFRAARYAELAARMKETVPVVPLWHEDQVCVLSRRAGTFTLSADGRWSALAELAN